MNVDVPNMLTALGIHWATSRNGELWAACPYPGHPEAEPSWSIRWDGPSGQRNGFNHCFGCHEEGGPVGLVRAVVGLDSASAAVEWIRSHGLDLDDVAPLACELVIRGMYAPSLGLPAGVIVGPLSTWVTPARRYAMSRGITAAQVDRWGIGYGAAGPLLSRLYLPSHDAMGELQNWTARSFSGRSPRYRNPDAELGANASAMFGERYWPADPSGATVVVTEGELNSLACERAGAEFVAALGGSQLDGNQVLKLGKFARIVLATDADRAGSAIANALSASLGRWRVVGRVDFPPGSDACDVERIGGIDALRVILP